MFAVTARGAMSSLKWEMLLHNNSTPREGPRIPWISKHLFLGGTFKQGSWEGASTLHHRGGHLNTPKRWLLQTQTTTLSCLPKPVSTKQIFNSDWLLTRLFTARTCTQRYRTRTRTQQTKGTHPDTTLFPWAAQMESEITSFLIQFYNLSVVHFCI